MTIKNRIRERESEKNLIATKKGCIFRAFKKFSFKDKFDYQCIYPTTHDAVLSIFRKNKITIRPSCNNRKKSAVHIHLDTNRRDSRPVRFLNRKRSSIFDDITAISLEPKSNELKTISEATV